MQPEFEYITRPDEALSNIRNMQGEYDVYPDLVRRSKHAHAYYCDDRDPDHLLFGFSKRIGVRNATAEDYLKYSRWWSGSITERILPRWFCLLERDSPDYPRYERCLREKLASLGTKPGNGFRIMRLKPNYRDLPVETEEDRSLLDLLLAVAERLPDHQRRELIGRLRPDA